MSTTLSGASGISIGELVDGIGRVLAEDDRVRVRVGADEPAAMSRGRVVGRVLTRDLYPVPR